ncbi:hypothetical protein C347_04844 [Cryptococcus neoformans AD2-60a]|nr:hypothetical protein C347_04844 [Cryptococcus neoformans var. grubii AD2-60a]
MVSTGEITDVFEKMDGLEKEFASFKAKIESIQRTTQVESAELDITRLDELKDNLIEDQGVDPFAGSNCTDPTAVHMIRMKNNYLLPSSHSMSFRRDAKSIQIFPDCIVISEIKKLDEIKKETTFTMKDRFNANIMMAVCRLMWGMQSPSSIRWGRENLKIGELFLW